MLDSHKQAFIEEAAELLVSLEYSLLELEQNPEDNEIIAKVFRALHTIKGSSGMFGFDDISIFTHDIETMFDLVRNGEISVTKELISLTLSARDQISAMLKETETQKFADDDITKELVVTFRNMVINTKFISEAAKNSQPADDETVADEEVQKSKSTYKIYFRPATNIFSTGANPLLLLNELKLLGNNIVCHHSEDIPDLENIQEEECYSGWDIIVSTLRDRDTIKDIFIFVEDDCQLTIEILDNTGKLDNENFYSFLESEIGKTTEADYKKLVAKYRLLEQDIQHIRKSEVPEKKKIIEKDDKQGDHDTATSIRVSAEKLDNLVNLVGELVTVQARLTQTANSANDPELVIVAEEVERLTWELRDSALNIRMLPIGTTFSKFKRLVRDLTQELGKEVELITTGGETELDKTVIERLNDPLVHIIRNSIDHGIELPKVREAAGKSRVGKVNLSATQSGGSVIIKIQDDGAGLDKEAIRVKAVSQGLISAETELKESELYSLIFTPGFSTAKKVTSISGRGVGMDVVKQAIDNLRGSVEIVSAKEAGSTIILKLPLTLAIIDGLLVQIGGDSFILPLSVVEECIELSDSDIEKVHGRNLVHIRGEIVPYIPLRKTFNIPGDRPLIEQVVISNVNGVRVGFAVDYVIGSHQTVLKNLGRVFKFVQGVSGATILGNGNVALILDILKIIQNAEAKEKLKVASAN
ncbi:MAG: chemotaxis protein CheA [Ignavibacteria bacterium]